MNLLTWGIYLVVFCLPLYLVRFSILNIPTNVLEAMVGILFIIWVIKKVKSPANSAGRRQLKVKIKDLNLFISIILILIGVSLATIFSWDLQTSAGIWKSWFIVPLVFFVILITTIKPKQVKKIFWVFILSALVVAVISLIQWNLDGVGRLQGIYTSPNYLAMYLAPALVLVFGYCLFAFFAPQLRGSGLVLRRVFLASSFCLFIIVLFFTKSVGAWLGVVAALSFGLVLYLRKSNKKRLIWLVVVLGLIIILAISYLKIFSEQGRISFNARLIIWDMAWYIFEARPIIGIGPGAFEGYFPSYPAWGGVPQPHNLYLAFLLQTGLIGFIGFIWLLVWFFRIGLRSLITDYRLQVTLVMAMTYILIHGLVDTTYWKNDLSMFFWTIIGLMAVLKKPR